ncbi:zinc ABC transporter substrate-binding protein [Dethiosulfovibrio sp. F2B]|uniref:metal ABC transporter solute-binding protein, Zn/Mn family n=1 Tax=Dethiosulfovibrio faecalis TaxID=2720018 RepID=UPI001F40D79A|nr:zinc ABC transporter substrate-binding protein [Dethiosulfovibrio faecalis]MCF4151501.1 zinc ABC transporter substrate-binding protein [Dethiosulfovibrio faecalis]
MRKFFLWSLTAALCLTAGAALASPTLHVAVSILPQKFFVEKIGGSYVDVTTVVPKGASPATYEPKPSQMAELSSCSLWFTIGVPFERAQKDRLLATLPDLKEVPTYQGVKLYPIEGADHDHGALDPHIWLSPPEVMLQVRSIAMALAEADPPRSDVYMSNYIKFAAELADLDRHLAQELAPLKGRSFMVFHPSWGYFARAYGLRQRAVELEGKEPKPAELGRLVELAKNEGIDTIFVQPQFSTAAAKTLAETLKGEVAPMDPLAEDWDFNLRKVAKALRKALR